MVSWNLVLSQICHSFWRWGTGHPCDCGQCFHAWGTSWMVRTPWLCDCFKKTKESSFFPSHYSSTGNTVNFAEASLPYNALGGTFPSWVRWWHGGCLMGSHWVLALPRHPVGGLAKAAILKLERHYRLWIKAPPQTAVSILCITNHKHINSVML